MQVAMHKEGGGVVAAGGVGKNEGHQQNTPKAQSLTQIQIRMGIHTHTHTRTHTHTHTPHGAYTDMHMSTYTQA